MIGHRLMGSSLVLTGTLVEGRAHLDRALALYDPVQHRPLATRFGQDVAVVGLVNRSQVLWLLGYPDAALADAERALKAAREIGHAATLLYALSYVPNAYVEYGNYATAKAVADEGGKLASEKGALFWGALGMLNQGSILGLTGQTSEAVQMLTDGLAASRQTGSMLHEAAYLALLARTCAELGQLDDARRCIDDAIGKVERSKERWCEAEVHRIAGEIALKSLAPDLEQAEAYFEHALTVARRSRLCARLASSGPVTMNPPPDISKFSRLRPDWKGPSQSPARQLARHRRGCRTREGGHRRNGDRLVAAWQGRLRRW
jgi:predicted ATPase